MSYEDSVGCNIFEAEETYELSALVLASSQYAETSSKTRTARQRIEEIKEEMALRSIIRGGLRPGSFPQQGL